MVKLPPYLKKGDTIGILCPAGYMPVEKAATCMNVLEQWGYKVKAGVTLGGGSTNYFSGPDIQRRTELQQMLDDPQVKAILCARGGYGMGRIIDELDFSYFRKHPKWIIGFSDITVLQSHIFTNFRIASLHAPMAAAFNDDEYKNEYIDSLKRALEGKKARYQATPHTFNRKGEAVGELVGGNLAMIAHLVGTPSDIKTKNRILFLEDVGEYLYNIDRMLRQLKRSGKLNRLAGLIIGGFTDNKDTDRPFGKTAYEIIKEVIDEYDYPVCFNFPVSHGKENYALKVGAGYKLRVGKHKVSLEE